MMNTLPRHFCWTKFGSEAGESIDSILARKERERLANDGLFLWGVGNSVGPGIRRLIQLEAEPLVVFSPMRATPKKQDVAPDRVVAWTRATGLHGKAWDIPRGSRVTSRAGTVTRLKSSHYALVCRSPLPLDAQLSLPSIAYESLRNLESGNVLGYSQVTSVVEHMGHSPENAAQYPIGFVAGLVSPYFVVLTEPIDMISGERYGCQAALELIA